MDVSLEYLVRFGKAYSRLGSSVQDQFDRLLEGGPFEPGEINGNAVKLIEREIRPLLRHEEQELELFDDLIEDFKRERTEYVGS